MRKILLISIACTFASGILWAIPRSSASLGSGGGGVATVEPGESSFMNPATLVHLRGRHFYSTFQKDLWALSLTENDRSAAFPGGISYIKNERNDTESQIFGLTVSNFIFDKFSGGFTLNYWQVEGESREDQRKTSFNGNFGVAWAPSKKFGMGAAFENIITPPDELKDRGLMEPVSRVGLNYLFQEWFRGRLDFATFQGNNFAKMTPQVGFETYFGKWFIFRTGWSKNPGLRESWAAGAGLDMPRFRLDFANEWNADGLKENRHSVDLAVPF